MKAEKPYSPRKLKIGRHLLVKGDYLIRIPEIRLCGQWLQDLGFAIGRYVNIEQQENKLIITLLEVPVVKVEHKKKNKAAHYCANCARYF